MPRVDLWSSATRRPRDSEDMPAGTDGGVTDPGDRDLDSKQTDDTRYDRALEDEARRRHEAAERLKRDQLPEPDDDSAASCRS